jgi:hypothetical protein
MKPPGRTIDLSVHLENETVLDLKVILPEIEYKTKSEYAWKVLESGLGLRAEDLPG